MISPDAFDPDDLLTRELLDKVDELITTVIEHPDLPAALTTIRRQRAEVTAHARAIDGLRVRYLAQGLPGIAADLQHLLDQLPDAARP